MFKYTRTDEQFTEAIKNSYTMGQALKLLGLKPHGGNYSIAKRRISKLGLDISHWGTIKDRHGWAKNKTLGVKKPIEYYLKLDSNIGSHLLKLRLIKENIFMKKCSNCNLETWQNQPIPLELDHINGINNDNRLENLRLLCPNCHAQTPTYRIKKNTINKRNSINNKIIKKTNSKEYNCIKCNDLIKTENSRCRKCFLLDNRKVERPSKEVLEQEIKENSWVALGKKYGVSDNAIRKWAKYYNINLKQN